MLVRACVVAAAICLVPSALAAQDVPAAQEPAPAKEKKVCRSVVPTGTIMAKRICLTKSEWTEFHSRNERHNDMFRDNKNKGLKPEEM
jgi:hypothetical protein